MRYRSNIFVALIPPNKEGELILKQTLFFQQSLGMRVFILNVVKRISIFIKMFNPQKVSLIEKENYLQLNNFITNVIQKEGHKELIPKIRIGKTVKILESESKDGGYEFLVINKNSSEGIDSLSLADVNRIISRCYCPVLTINRDYLIDKVKKIIVPIDISYSTKKNLLWTTFFAKKLGARIQIVSALTTDIEVTKSLVFKNAEKIKELLVKRGLDCKVEILKVQKQSKHKAILEYIEKENPELVIIRTHKEQIFSGAKIGKFVSAIVHGCNMPVFTVGGSTEPPIIDT